MCAFICETLDIAAEIMRIEISPNPDWGKISELADDALRLTAAEQIGDQIDPYLIKYFDDVDIRENEPAYGDHQRLMISEALRNAGFSPPGISS